jgi:antitoxin component of RelBE/YafQ-DinJ toxin-antitoxin module
MPTKRKPMTQDKTVLIRIDEKLKDKAQKAALKKGLSLSDFIRQLLKDNS